MALSNADPVEQATQRLGKGRTALVNGARQVRHIGQQVDRAVGQVGFLCIREHLLDSIVVRSTVRVVMRQMNVERNDERLL